MTTTDRMQGLEMALEAVLRDVLAAENDMASAQFRLHHAREAAAGLQGLVGAERARAIAEAVGVSLPVRRPQSGPTDAARRAAMDRRRAAEQAERERHEVRRAAEPALPSRRVADFPESMQDRALAAVPFSVAPSPNPGEAGGDTQEAGDDPSSTERVIQLLREYEGKAIPRAMIIEQFEKRGWVDPTWAHPGPAIRMAIRRATEKGAAKLVGDGRYLYVDPGLLGEVPDGGDA